MLANVPLPRHSSSFLKPPNSAKNLERGLNVSSNSSQYGRGRYPFHSLFQKHFSCGVLGCGRRLPYLCSGGNHSSSLSFYLHLLCRPLSCPCCCSSFSHDKTNEWSSLHLMFHHKLIQYSRIHHRHQHMLWLCWLHTPSSTRACSVLHC
jgi:hypothetical protein